MVAKKTVLTDYLVAAGAAALGAGLLTQSGAVSKGIQSGLQICTGVLIPALFPFMALSGFLSLTNAAKILSIPLTPLTTRVFKLPRELGAIVFLSMVGGYPVGAKSVSLLLSQGKISKKTAERMLCFCVNCGPSFLITAVGAGMLFSKTAGVILFFTQTVATLLIGAAVSFKAKALRAGAATIDMSAGPAFVASVSGASSAMLTMCSFAVLFSGMLSLVTASGVIREAARFFNVGEGFLNAVVCGLFEVTSGCVSAASLGGEMGFALVSAAASFGGLSILFQIISCFRDNPVNFRGMILCRICHIPLSILMALPLYRRFCETQSVYGPAAGAVIHTDWRTAIITVCLLCMCVIITLSASCKRF